MHIQIEPLFFVLYMDSLFSEGVTREVTPLRTVPETLNRLYAQAMREHARQSALLWRVNGDWSAIPDWRLDRHVIRVGLYMRERLGVEPGERVALVSELRPEWLVADLAALGLGAVSVAIDPGLQRDELLAALEDAAPRVTFASTAALDVLQSPDGGAPSNGSPYGSPYGRLIALDGAAARDDVMPFQALLEMGGTLDTPERAQSYRADARGVPPDQPAIDHYRRAPGGGCDRVQLSHDEVIQRLKEGWLREPARPGDVAYVGDPTVSLTARLALYAFLGDGYTTTAIAPAIAPAGGERSDLTTLRPAKIIAPAVLLAEAVAAAESHPGQPRPRAKGWLRHAARLAPRERTRGSRDAIRHMLGDRVRWIGSGDPIDVPLAERLGTVAVVEPVPR
jgi:hypothetical protein